MDTKVVATLAPTSGVVEGQRSINGEGILIARLRAGEKEVRFLTSITASRPPGSPQEFEVGGVNWLISSIAFEPGRCRSLPGVRVTIDGS